MKAINQKDIISIVNTYKTKNQIKKMQETIMYNYGIATNAEFVAKILKPAKELINDAISMVYDGAIDKVKDGNLALLDALKRAKSDFRFSRVCRALDVDLQTTEFITRKYYRYISIDGQIAKRCVEYAKNEDGEFILDSKGKRVISLEWFEYKEITANNAPSIIVNCLNKMKSVAKSEIALIDGWNIVKIGKPENE